MMAILASFISRGPGERRLKSTAFGTLMALEPAFGVLIGLLVLHQHPTILQAAGVAIIIAAGIGGQHRGQQHHPSTAVPEPLPRSAW